MYFMHCLNTFLRNSCTRNVEQGFKTKLMNKMMSDFMHSGIRHTDELRLSLNLSAAIRTSSRQSGGFEGNMGVCY